MRCARVRKALTYHVCCVFTSRLPTYYDLFRLHNTKRLHGLASQSRDVFDRKYSGRPRRRGAPLNDLLGDYRARTQAWRRCNKTPVGQLTAAEFTQHRCCFDYLACLLPSPPPTSIHRRATHLRPPTVFARRRMRVFCCFQCVAFTTSRQNFRFIYPSAVATISFQYAASVKRRLTL